MGWNDVGMNAGGADFLKIEPGQSVLVHVLSDEPVSFFQYYNQDVQRGLVVPPGFKDSSIKLRAQHAVLVWSFKDEAVKIWAMGNRLATQVKGIMDTYDGSLSTVDINLKRNGTGKDTTYIPTPKPTTFDQALIDGVELPVLEEVFAPGSEEDIENLKNGIVPQREDDEVASGSGDESAGESAGATTATVTRTAPAKATAPAKTASPADQRLALVKQVTQLFATNAKYKTPAARLTLIKSIAKGKTTLSQLSVPELQTLVKKAK